MDNDATLAETHDSRFAGTADQVIARVQQYLPDPLKGASWLAEDATLHVAPPGGLDFHGHVRMDADGIPWVVVDSRVRLASPSGPDGTASEDDLVLIDQLNRHARGYVAGFYPYDQLIAVATHVAAPLDDADEAFAAAAARVAIEMHALVYASLRGLSGHAVVPRPITEDLRRSALPEDGWTRTDVLDGLDVYRAALGARGYGDVITVEPTDTGARLNVPLPSSSTDVVGAVDLSVDEDGSVLVDVRIGRGMGRRRAERMVRRLNESTFPGTRTHTIAPQTLGAWRVDGRRHGQHMLAFTGRISGHLASQGTLLDHVESLVRMTVRHWDVVRTDYRFSGIVAQMTRCPGSGIGVS